MVFDQVHAKQESSRRLQESPHGRQEDSPFSRVEVADGAAQEDPSCRSNLGMRSKWLPKSPIDGMDGQPGELFHQLAGCALDNGITDIEGQKSLERAVFAGGIDEQPSLGGCPGAELHNDRGLRVRLVISSAYLDRMLASVRVW